MNCINKILPIKLAAFTLIEVLLSVAVIFILSVGSISVSRAFQINAELDMASNIIVQSMHRAQVLSQSMEGDSSWGVKVQVASVTLFKGVDYASRDTIYDENFSILGSILPSGLDEVVYAKMTGLPMSTGTITLSIDTGKYSSLLLNSMGMVEY